MLLAGPSPAELVPDSADLARDRRALLAGSLSLGELLDRRGLLLRADLLTPWARWITPEFSPRRFDTWFFAAALPAGQLAGLAAAESGASESGASESGEAESGESGSGAPESGESDSGTWWRPSAALEAARANPERSLQKGQGSALRGILLNGALGGAKLVSLRPWPLATS